MQACHRSKNKDDMATWLYDYSGLKPKLWSQISVKKSLEVWVCFFKVSGVRVGFNILKMSEVGVSGKMNLPHSPILNTAN